MAFQQTEQGVSSGGKRHLAASSGPHLGSLRNREEHWQQHQGKKGPGEGLIRGLGWFSIGLGLAGVVTPQRLAQLIGVRDDSETCTVLRTVGLRELVTGVGILTQPQPTGWLWARVGGDVIDLALLGSALNADGTNQGRIAAATAAVLGVTALDLRCSEQLSRSSGTMLGDGSIHVKKAITINRSAEDLYRFWRDFQNLPRFMSHLESVQVTGEKQSHWAAKGPAGTRVEWDAEIINDKPNELIVWRSLKGADVDNSGLVQFERAPGGRGTMVTVRIDYHPPGGALGAAFAKLFGEAPEQQVQDDLRRFKQVMEIGEVVQSESSIHRSPHPARPAPRVASVR